MVLARRRADRPLDRQRVHPQCVHGQDLREPWQRGERNGLEASETSAQSAFINRSRASAEGDRMSDMTNVASAAVDAGAAGSMPDTWTPWLASVRVINRPMRPDAARRRRVRLVKGCLRRMVRYGEYSGNKPLGRS